MKKFLLLMLVSVSGFTLSGCWNKDNISVPGSSIQETTSMAEWKYEKTIPTPITKASTAGEDIVLGDMAENNVSVMVPKGTFDQDTQVQVMNPDEVPDYIGSEIDPIGAPIEISTGQPIRLNEKVTISFKFDKGKLSPDTEKGQMRVMYYDGAGWEYIKPLSVDMEAGLMTFETYHFSLFGANKIKDETKLTEQWIHSAALDKELRDRINNTSDAVTGKIIDMTLEKMGISDKTIKGKVLADVLKDDEYKEIYDSYQAGNTTDAGQKLAILAGKKIAKNVPESVFKTGLSTVTGRAKDITAVSKAAGHIAGGQFEDAAKVIGEQIADKFIITTAGKIAVEVVDYQIQSWKSGEVEAAYKAYKDGANGVFWGYNVDAKDFDGVWDQMRGIRRQLEIEAIKRENKVRSESGMEPLTESQEEALRNTIKESYRRQFETRLKNEDAIEKRKQELKLVIDAYKNANFFDKTMGPEGLDKGLDYEGKLEVLTHFMDKMMKDTNRSELSTKSGLIMDKAISVDDVVQGARYYFSGPEGRKKYAEYIKERFGIDLYPKLSDIAGKWDSGSMTITDVILSEELKKAIAEGNAPKDEGCDLSMNFEELKGKTVPFSFTLEPSGDSSGSISIKTDESDGKTVPFTYEGGQLTATMSEQGGVGTLSMTISQDQTSYGAAGSFNINYKEGMIKIIASVKSSKAKAKKP